MSAARAALAACLLAACLLGGAPPARAVQETEAQQAAAAALEQGWRAARAAFVEQLVALAEQAGESKLYGTHDALLARVLSVDADNEAAREGLGHKRQKDGTWKEPKKARTRRDLDGEAAAALAPRVAAAEAALAARAAELLAAHEAQLAPPRRAALVAELLTLAPDDPSARRLGGEARVGEAWVLVETETAARRRPELKALVRQAFDETPAPPEVAPDAREQALGLPWTAVVDAGVARVLGTGAKDEVLTFGRVLPVARRYFHGAFGAGGEYYPGATVFLLARPADRDAFLAAHPKVDAAARQFLATLRGSGIQGSSDIAHWGEDEGLRRDGATRIALGWLLYTAFEITPRQAWAFEGIGIYMTRELVGTRLTWFAQPSEYLRPEEERALRERLLDPKTNWMAEAQRLLASDKPPKLTFLFGRDLNSMTPEDVLLAYVFAAYLLEGRPDEAPELLRKVGAGVAPAVAVQDVLGVDVRTLDQRLRRWLDERR